MAYCCGEKKNKECVIRDYMYQIYEAIWAAAIGEELVCTREVYCKIKFEKEISVRLLYTKIFLHEKS